ncbi:type I-C CRISPR-associated endonuclease Cas1c [Anaerovorax odorimutans]|uniref:CRISPR-associated endonuclease Cas1 n=1 Tax=Anaerovorax odorimutans TaxID=109327 RepID=A0ABT1RLG8_9FIRM|nr:type I-C CRISPR-associated endonuclease Cas1c [Anaerovorax odorimutans]MCQ4636029.1 type I-C CRISPR-associated endonuclease Cas1c [Anaerovorax odorimutans]
MKKLLNTLYILSEDVYLALDGENVIVLREEETAGRFPLHTLENIVSFSYKGASPALMGACASREIGLSFYSPRGKFLAHTVGASYGNVLLRKEQYRISGQPEKSLAYAKNMITGKVFNCRWSLERTIRDNGMRIDTEKVKHASFLLNEGLSAARKCENMDSLRGLEGKMASRYFSVFNELIINQKDDFRFNGRSRRPPMDNINALLSFVYTILGNECAGALEGVGLDAYVGFMHCDRPGRESLALDLLEELRGIMADRFVLTLINKKIIKGEHFDRQGDGAVLLSEEGRKQFFSAWQSRKKETLTHPFLKEKIPWGLVPYVQALLLARTIRGDLEAYPPFLWK